MDKGKGLYLGTEIDEKWWKRYKKNKMFARGNGEYWFDEEGIYFRRYLTKTPIFIAYNDMQEIKLGKWHAGQWGMSIPIIKILWSRDGLNLSSGFILSKNKEDIMALKARLEDLLSENPLPASIDTKKHAENEQPE